MYKIFLVIPPGFETLAKKEITQLFPDIKSIDGSEELEYECDLETIYKLNLTLRIPTRILVRFAEFDAKTFQDLFQTAVRLPWKQFIRKDMRVAIRTTCHKSKLYHSSAVTQRIHQAMEAHLSGKVPLIKTESEELHEKHQLIIVRLLRDTVTISIDSSGDPLYMRGYREIAAKAPIRENLAAGLLFASGWNPEKPLMDPFCGSGTIPIEAALIAKNQPPGLYRDFAFEHWHAFKQNNWQEIRRSYISNLLNSAANIFGSDRDSGAIEIAKTNAEKAKVDQLIHWQQLSISEIVPADQPGWIITNPPYGVRVSSNKDMRNLYARFGDHLRKNFSGWELIFLCNSGTLANHTHLKPKSLLSFSNGGINVQAFYARI
ncbi:MAG TPA: class I SAM-dependent RNA methyltransferase [Anaerolineaceae bacterium]|nr:class I SAM-dependent RNA methyltransferase [Anaerolineaceae bacterium]